jgi:hypothetical protein
MLGVLLSAAALGSGSASAGDPVAAVQASGSIPEDRLLDVGVEVFELSRHAGKPIPAADPQVLEDVRRAEGRFLPIQLRDTLESTGQWGAVRVLPPGLSVTDLTVYGEMLHASGRRLELRIRAVDSRGRKWLDREYYWQAEAKDYPSNAPGAGYAFRSVFNQIANDLVRARDKRDTREIQEIRRTTEMRFAAEIAPEAFADHVRARGEGSFEVARLPAEGDPMMARVLQIRERDHAVVDTLNEHYSEFQARMSSPYNEWLAQSFQEQKAYDALNKKSLLKKILGAALIVGAIAADQQDRDYGTSAGTEVLIIGGIAAIESGIKDGQEKKVHEDTLGELATQLEAGVTPLVVAIEGRTVELKGTAEEQYGAWRKMLREIFVAETGLPADPNAPVGPDETPGG